MLAIETIALEKAYRLGFWRKTAKLALRPLTLGVEEGEIFGYLGPNGAGKTTTLKLLMGLVFPTGGSARILGMELDDPRLRRQIGFLPEQPYFYDYLTASELLNYYAQLSGLIGPERGRRVEAMLARVGLAEAGRAQLRRFSKGMLQRLAIAQAIIHDPKLVFLDEPMSGLDPLGRREVRDLIQSLKDEGKTVFFSTHILSDAEALCDRVAVLCRGELRGVGVVAELESKHTGRVEVVWRGIGAPAEVNNLALEYHTSANNTARATVIEANLNPVLDALRQGGAQIISAMPVRSTLEDYFIERLQAEPEPKPEDKPEDQAGDAPDSAPSAQREVTQ